MSSSVFEATLAFEPTRSRLLAGLVVSAWSLPVLASALYLSVPATAMIAAAACAGFAFDWRRLAPVGPMYWSGDGDWRLGDPEGPAWRLSGATRVMPWVILLVLRGPRRTLRIALARDAVDPVVWRRLRARLRVQGRPLVEAP